MKPQKQVAFTGVFDKRGSRVRGLWQRGSVFYAQLRVTNPITGRRIPQKISLGEDVTTIPQAQQAAAEMKTKERSGELKGTKDAPTFADYMDYYLKHAKKHPHTLDNEKSFLNQWEGYFGGNMRLDRIAEPAIRDFIHKELKKEKPLSNHSINCRIYALRSMLRMAKDERLIKRLPFDGIKKLKHVSARKELPTTEEIEKIVSTAIKHCPKSGQQFADYLHLLMFSGAREKEALSLQWSDIDFTTRQIHFHRGTKYGKARYIVFNDKLEALLKDMNAKRDTKSVWLFTSPRPNTQGGRITSFRTTLEKVRAKAKIYLSEHYLRHYFISKAVMAGIAIPTLVKWVGHADGGKLIMNTYGHLTNAYELEQATKLTNL
jgi:integrase